jgi:hypothetical protein
MNADRVSSWLRDYLWVARLEADARKQPRRPEEFLVGDATPVLLLPGVYETWRFLEPVAELAHALGHPVHVIPELGRTLVPVPHAAKMVCLHLQEHDLRNVTIIAHSKGGLIGKLVMVTEPVGERVRRMLAINTPFGGSSLARYAPNRTLRDFVPTDATIASLAAAAHANERITSVFSRFDPIIPEGSELPGATNIRLDVDGHFRLLDDPRLLEIVIAAVRDD